MTADSQDLHGSAPDKSKIALLLIDVINDLAFPGSEGLVEASKEMATAIHQLKHQARELKIPVVYVNDNFGRWRSDFRAQVSHCLTSDVPGKPMVQMLEPTDQDYFVLKPKHSGFFSTTLDTLLQYLEVKTVILTGVAANICVLFTANDAYMRDLKIVVPSDCVASNTTDETAVALEQMRVVLKADTRRSNELSLKQLLQSD